jgi:hypothetical protein
MKAPVNGPSGFQCRKLLPRGATRPSSLIPLPHGTYRLPTYRAAEDDLGGLRPPAIDLYAGGGGLLYGVNQHFDVQHAVETAAPACHTLRANFTAKVHRCSVHDFTRGRSRHRRPAPGSVALLVAGPPW